MLESLTKKQAKSTELAVLQLCQYCLLINRLEELLLVRPDMLLSA